MSLSSGGIDYSFQASPENWRVLNSSFQGCTNDEELSAPHFSAMELTDFTIPSLLEQSKYPGTVSHRLYLLTNELVQTTKILSESSAFILPELEKQLFDHVFRFMDFAADIVGFRCVTLLSNIISIHKKRCDECTNENSQSLCSLLNNVRSSLTEVCVIKKCRANALIHFVKSLPKNKCLFSIIYLERLYSQIENGQISQLLIEHMSLFPEHRSHHLVLIKKFILCESYSIRQAIEKKHIPAILRNSILACWFIENLQEIMDLPKDSAYYLEAVLSLSRHTIFYQSNIPFSIPSILTWYDFFNEETMKEALRSENSKIKLAAWSLLADHPKSVWPCTLNELKMAEQFVSENLCLSEPIDRKTFFLMLKKLLLRIHEHARVVIRQQLSSSFNQIDETYLENYGVFLHRLHRLAFDSLEIELKSNEPLFSRRVSALTIIALVCLRQFCAEGATNRTSMESEPPLSQKFAVQKWTGQKELSLLLLCLDGEFENTQDLALKILEHQSQFINEGFDEIFFMEFLKRTKDELIFFDTLKNEHSTFAAAENLGFSTVFGSALYKTICHRLYFAFLGLHAEASLALIDELLTICEKEAQKLDCFSTNLFGLFETNLDFLYRLFIAIQAILTYKEKVLIDGGLFKKEKRSWKILGQERIISFGLRSTNSELCQEQTQALSDAKMVQNEFSMAERIVALCLTASRIVEPIVHSLTPEGYFPEDPKHKQYEDQSTPIDSASFFDYQLFSNSLNEHSKKTEYYQRFVTTCWRLHASFSAILAQIVVLMPSPKCLPMDVLCNIGEFFWLQLTACRHCGAFESAADAFETVCRSYWRFSVECVALSPRHWLEQILEDLCGKNVVEKSVLQTYTIGRRSAGLPHLVHAIVITEPQGKCRERLCLDFAMQKLLDVCEGVSSEQDLYAIRVHCVNVLRLLISSSAVAEQVLSHAERAFRVALFGTAATDWRLRNAHNQLFAALLRRVFGTPDAVQHSVQVQPRCKLSALEFFTRFPSLYDLIFQKLRCSVSKCSNGSKCYPSFFDTFALLVLLTHLHPSGFSSSPSFDDQHNGDSILNSGASVNRKQKNGCYELTIFAPDLIRVLFTASAHKSRELAAAALVSILRRSELVRILKWISGAVGRFEHEEPESNIVDALICLLSLVSQAEGQFLLDAGDNATRQMGSPATDCGGASAKDFVSPPFASETSAAWKEESDDLHVWCKSLMYVLFLSAQRNASNALGSYCDMLQNANLDVLDDKILNYMRRKSKTANV